MGLIAIGDIHGCAKSLDALLNELQPGPEDHLVFIGDYIDRGPDSRGVIDRLIELEQERQCTFLRGNHESLFLGYIDHAEYDIFAHNGGRATLESYPTRAVSDDHVAFIRRTRMYLETEDYLFVHAGLRPYMTVEENLQDGDEMVFLWHRSHIGSTNDELEWEKTVVCGHTPVSEPIDLPRLINIDTGCVFRHRKDFGHLTAVRLPEREFVAVECVD